LFIQSGFFILEETFTTLKKLFYLKFVLLLSICLLSVSLFGQEVVKKRKHINTIWDAEYEVLASDKKIKHGLFTIINTLNKKVIAIGKYSNNIQSGNWLYYDLDGKLVQRYNFDTKDISFDNPILLKANYKFPFELMHTDSVNVPIKIGGFYYGLNFVFFEANNQALMYAFRMNLENYKLIQYLHIDENGQLTNWETLVKSSNTEQKFKNSLDNLDNEQKLFLPAIHNKKPISCIMMIEMDLKNNSVKKLPYQ
jgi:hypothetical protein